MSEREEARVMAIDPGRTCGFATSDGSWGKMDSGEFLTMLFDEVAGYMYDRLVVENFHTRQKGEDGEATLKVIGAIEFIAMETGTDLGYVEPSAKKAMKGRPSVLAITNRHARDAEAIRLWDLRFGKW